MSYMTFADSPYARSVLTEFKNYQAHHRGYPMMVIKVGGGIVDDADLFDDCIKAIDRLVSLGLYPVIIHGGGPQISSMLESIGEKARFCDGLRVTSEVAIAVVAETLASINDIFVQQLEAKGVEAVGITRAFDATYLDRSKYGEVGRITDVHKESINQAISRQNVPVVSCLAFMEGRPLNVNGDDAAAKLVSLLRPLQYISFTPTGGVIGSDGAVIKHLDHSLAKEMYSSQLLDGGMYKKVQEALTLIDKGTVEKIIIVHPHHLIDELFSESGYGTIISE